MINDDIREGVWNATNFTLDLGVRGRLYSRRCRVRKQPCEIPSAHRGSDQCVKRDTRVASVPRVERSTKAGIAVQELQQNRDAWIALTMGTP